MGNKTIYSPIIKNRVIATLKEHGITQKDMANDLYISPEHLSRCLKKGQVSLSWLYAIAEYLNCSPEWLSKEDAPNLSSFGFSRGKAIDRQDEILTDLFLLLGFTSEQYEMLSPNDRESFKMELSHIIGEYIYRSKNRQEQENESVAAVQVTKSDK